MIKTQFDCVSPQGVFRIEKSCVWIPCRTIGIGLTVAMAVLASRCFCLDFKCRKNRPTFRCPLINLV